MNTSPNQNHIFKTAKDIQLTQAEKNSGWLALHHTISQAAPKKATPSPWQYFFMPTSMVAAAFLLTFGGVGYSSLQSKPNDTLYSLKVNVVEDIVGLTYFSAGAKLDYSLSLLETRLVELQYANNEPEPSDESLALIEKSSAEQKDVIHHIVIDTTSADLSYQSKLVALVAVSSVESAKQQLRGSTEGTTQKMAVDVEHEALLDRTIDAFLLEASEDIVTDYIGSQLTDIQTSVVEAGTSKATLLNVTQEINDIDDSIATNDLKEAIVNVHEAEILIDQNILLAEES